jgi:hypothetical protein
MTPLQHSSGVPAPRVPVRTKTILSWSLFFQALARQKPEIRYAWMRYLMFSDEGAALLPRSTESLLSVEERQKQLVLVLMAQKRWLNTLR